MTRGGYINDSVTQTRTTDTAITYEGTVVAKNAVARGCTVAADASVEPIGYAFVNTKNPVTGVAEANKPLTVAALIEGHRVGVPIIATNAEISIGDEIVVSANGICDKKDGAGWVLGTAEEAIDATTGGYVEIMVSKRYEAA